MMILITKGVFPSTREAPSSSRVLLGTRWFQVYTATPVIVLCICWCCLLLWKKRRRKC